MHHGLFWVLGSKSIGVYSLGRCSAVLMVYVEEVDYDMVISNRGSIFVSNGVVATNNVLLTIF